MDKTDSEKLEILVNHWIEHNREHTEEYKGWAEKAKSFGQVTVHDDIMRAVQHMNCVNELLLKALESLRVG